MQKRALPLFLILALLAHISGCMKRVPIPAAQYDWSKKTEVLTVVTKGGQRYRLFLSWVVGDTLIGQDRDPEGMGRTTRLPVSEVELIERKKFDPGKTAVVVFLIVPAAVIFGAIIYCGVTNCLEGLSN